LKYVTHDGGTIGANMGIHQHSSRSVSYTFNGSFSAFREMYRQHLANDPALTNTFKVDRSRDCPKDVPNMIVFATQTDFNSQHLDFVS
jgi:hypothetical protein